MPDPRLDVLCIGNAIVDVIANAGDDFLRDEGLVKGAMRLIDAEEAERLYAHMGPAHQVSGGSAGNTAAGVAALGGRAGFIGQVAPDQLGELYRHDLASAGVELITPAADGGPPTARSMIPVTPGGSTFCSRTKPRSRRWPGWRTSTARSRRSHPRSRRWWSRGARTALSRCAPASAPTCPRSRSTSWSTRPGQATCSPPASCSG